PDGVVHNLDGWEGGADLLHKAGHVFPPVVPAHERSGVGIDRIDEVAVAVTYLKIHVDVIDENAFIAFRNNRGCLADPPLAVSGVRSIGCVLGTRTIRTPPGDIQPIAVRVR